MANHQAVAHSWAHRSTSERTGHNMFHDGTTIYSYGSHFPIATHRDDWSGKILFNSNGYSSSTSQHKTHVRRAISHRIKYDVLFVSNPLASNTSEHEENIKVLVGEAAEALDKASRARSRKDEYMCEAEDSLDTAKQYHEHFFPRRKWAVSLTSLPEDMEKARKREARRQANLRKEQEKRRAEEMKVAAHNLELWKAGSTLVSKMLFHSLPCALRLSNRDELTVETSQGASVPLEAARQLFKLCERCRKDEGKMSLTFMEVGSYRGVYIDRQGNAQVGCHRLSYAEMYRLNETLKGEEV